MSRIAIVIGHNAKSQGARRVTDAPLIHIAVSNQTCLYEFSEPGSRLPVVLVVVDPGSGQPDHRYMPPKTPVGLTALLPAECGCARPERPWCDH